MALVDRSLRLEQALKQASERIPRREAEILVAHLLGKDRAWVVSHGELPIDAARAEEINLTIEARALGTPVAYLIGKREFYGRDFRVDQRVLIPRPETETLIEAALERVSAGERNVLDLGTGSGAIAVTLALERSQWNVTAVDASPDALDLAQENAVALSAENVVFLEGSWQDWYKPVSAWTFDLIVSNPPYVADGDTHLKQGDLRFEPKTALTDGSTDGLASIRAIVNGALARLDPGGWLLLEHGYDQGELCRDLLIRSGFHDVFSQADLAGIPRVAGGRRV
jgi:release factor glutamine methyltransferase